MKEHISRAGREQSLELHVSRDLCPTSVKNLDFNNGIDGMGYFLRPIWSLSDTAVHARLA